MRADDQLYHIEPVDEVSECALAIRSRARDDWDINRVIYAEADQFVEGLRQNGELPRMVGKALRELTWHRGVHTPRWVHDNCELLSEFVAYDGLSEEEKQDLRHRFSASIEVLLES